MKRKTLLHFWLLLLCMIVGGGTAWAAEKITDYTNIVSGKSYYIGSTVSNTDYYFYADGSTAATGVQGTSKTNKSEAAVLVFEGSGDQWTIKFNSSGNYLSLAKSKANGKVDIVANAATWTASNNSNLIQLKINDYLLQKNSGTSLNLVLPLFQLVG